MEKITKEELMEELKLQGLTDEDIEKISAGGDGYNSCSEKCRGIKDPNEQKWCLKTCHIAE